MWGRLAAGWQLARDPEGAPSTAAVRCNRGSWPIDNRPQLTKLPHRSAASLPYHLADESRRRPLNRPAGGPAADEGVRPTNYADARLWENLVPLGFSLASACPTFTPMIQSPSRAIFGRPFTPGMIARLASGAPRPLRCWRQAAGPRSEERRVGKECRSRWS